MSSEGSEARQRWIARGVDFMLIVIGALVLMLPSLRDGAPAGQDYPVHLAWTRAFTDQLAAGELYPRWLQGMWLGAGGSDFFFYGPLPYWLMGTIKFGFCPNCDADQLLVIAGVILLTVSGLGFRFLAGQFSGRWAAIAAALIYMALPYHLSAEWYARLALAEFTAVAILPWHMAAFLDCLNCGRRGPHLAVLTALILLAHLPTAIIVAAADLTLLLALRIRCDRRTIAVALFAGVVGGGLAAVYWYPAVAMLDSVRIDLQGLPAKNWRLNILLPQNFGRSVYYDWVWQAFAVLTGLSVAAMLLAPRVARSPARIVITLLVFVWVMVTPLSIMLWETTPVHRLQFPWRFLLIADLAFALGALMAARSLATLNIAWVRRGSAAAILLAFILTIAGVHPASRTTYGIGNVPKSSVRATAGAFEYLPRETMDTIGTRSYWSFFELAKHKAQQPALVLRGLGNVDVVSSRPRELVFDAELPAPGTVELGRTYWRYWRLRDAESERQIAIRPTSDFPLIAADLPSGRGRYVLELPVLPTERVGAYVSAGSLIVLLVWFWLSRRRTGS